MDPSSSSSSNGENIGETEDELGIVIVRAAMNGNVEIFDESSLSNEHLFRKGVEDNNILHIAILYNQYKFVRAFLEKYLVLNKKVVSERNSQGNTPLHVAAHQVDENLAMVKIVYEYMKKSVESGEGEKPWRAQNSDGNTALHLALRCRNIDGVIEFLVEQDPQLARIVNNSHEAPLHLAITHMDLRCPETTNTLLEKARCVASWRDAKGFTPLFRATNLDSRVKVKVIKMMIDACPESTLVCDASGKSFLHLLIQMEMDNQFSYYNNVIEGLMCLKEIQILKDHQDQDGNTPLHMAAICKNVHMVRCLYFKCSSNEYITNNDSISAMTMLGRVNMLHLLKEPRTMTTEDSDSAYKGHISFLIYRRRIVGLDFYGSQDSTGNNFLHLLMNKTIERPYLHSSSDYCHELYGFLHEEIQIDDSNLVYKTNQEGNTPVHILAQNKYLCHTLTLIASPSGHPNLLDELLARYDNAIKMRQDLNPDIPWVMQNAAGNTPLHEAILANNKNLAIVLLHYHSKKSTQLVNTHYETPLHLLARSDFGTERIVKAVMELNVEALGLRDKDGFTPILNALKFENLEMVVTLLQNNVQKLSDPDGQIFWNVVLNHQTKDFVNGLFQNEAFRKMLSQKDGHGNTPLHLAMKEKCFGFVQHFLETCRSERELPMGGNQSSRLIDVLSKPNNVGETPEDLLADLPTIPPKLEKTILNDRKLRGIRSSWGIPRTQLQNYMSSMNVIAALQTTITFTAAFTVPGGLNQDIGTPILIQSKSFQAFMIFDVIAMCLSMMVLICLLWMVATNKRESVMIQDFALTLLLLSFLATLLTFMTGVYATIYNVKLWIAVTTLVLCSLLMLFIPRFVLTNLLLHFKYPKVR